MDSNYYWIRIYDYDSERDMGEKGTLLDEFYLKDVDNGREGAKQQTLERYGTATQRILKFAKPRKGNGVYAILMESERFFYERFTATVDTYCFWCHKPVKGKASEFPRSYIGTDSDYVGEESVFTDLDKTAYFCSYPHKMEFQQVRSNPEGEFQIKEEGKDGDVFGYIYLIYNRAKDMYYIGQTRYLPFFRWQEHIKDGSKGDITDMSFSVLAEIYKTRDSDYDQQYLNSLEAWWIDKYISEKHQVFNITKPKITVTHLKERFKDLVEKQERLLLENGEGMEE